MKASPIYRFTKQSIHLDYPLLLLLLTLIGFGFCILYSASNSNLTVVFKQGLHLLLALSILFFLAMIPPHKYKNYTPFIYGFSLLLLIVVMLMGSIGKGAQRWLSLGGIRFQPSELMKLALPMMCAWYFEQVQPPLTLKQLTIGATLILVPAFLIMKQPDLGTAISVAISGLIVVFLSGISTRLIVAISALCIAAAPVLWHHLHQYQKQRILTLLDPESDPLGAGYHIIQSKIAIGSGGLTGKGWLLGSQSHLNFLPEHATDFIFAVNGEEFGFIGGLFLVTLILLITLRGLYIAMTAQTEYTRLLSASLILTFFFSAFINLGMVTGILPVVGIPLPLVSYGGTALVTFLATFGIIMSIGTHRILFNQTLR